MQYTLNNEPLTKLKQLEMLREDYWIQLNLEMDIIRQKKNKLIINYQDTVKKLDIEILKEKQKSIKQKMLNAME